MKNTLLSLFFTFNLFGCTSLLYYPTHDVYFDPAKINLKHENIYFQNYKNQKMHGWWFESKTKPAKGTLVFFHGNAENLTTHFIHLGWIPQEGYNYFIFDYPGFGESEGKPNEEGVVQTSYDAIQWVHQNKDSRPLILYGQSIGGITALRAALEFKNKIKFRAIIIDSSFPSYQKIATYKMSKHWFTWILQPIAYLIISDEYAPKNMAELSPIPILIIHGQKDNTVEAFWSDQLYEQLKEPKEIWRIPEGNHIQTFWIENRIYRKKFLEYLESQSK